MVTEFTVLKALLIQFSKKPTILLLLCLEGVHKKTNLVST